MHRRHSPFIALVLGIALAAGLSHARAQQGPGRGGPGGPGGLGMFGFGPGARGGELSLATDAAVQEELKLSDEQKTQLQDLAQKQRAAAFGGRRGPGANGEQGGAGGRPGGEQGGQAAAGRTPGQRGPGGAAGGPGGGRGFGAGGPGGAGFDPEAMRARIEAQRKETEAELDKILTKEQHERLEQIALRQEGPMAVTRKEIAEKIKLTPAQNTKIQAIVEQMRAQQAELRTSFRPNFGAPGEGGGRPNVDPEEMRAQFEKMRQATETLQNQAISRISQLLTRPQKDAFNTLLGEDFDLSKLSQQRGPQGGRGGARRGGNGGQPGDRDQENPE